MAKKTLSSQVQELKEENIELKKQLSTCDEKTKRALAEITSSLDALLKVILIKYGELIGNEDEKTYTITVPYPEISNDRPEVSRTDDGYRLSLTIKAH